VTLRERSFSNRQIESFLERFVRSDKTGGEYIGTKDSQSGFYPVYKIPGIGVLENRYGTFESETALENPKLEFLAFGHPLVDACIEYCKGNDFGGYCGVKFIHYKKDCEGLLCNFLVTFKSISRTQELIPVVVPACGGFSNYELNEIEEEALARTEISRKETHLYADTIERVSRDAALLYESARARIIEKVERRVWDLRETLDLSIDPEIEKITVSYAQKIKELEDQLARQENQSALFGKDMRSAMTRTKNKITEAHRERDHLLAKYRRYLGITYAIELVQAGVIVPLVEEPQ
jgi:hypothetical protein